MTTKKLKKKLKSIETRLDYRNQWENRIDEKIDTLEYRSDRFRNRFPSIIFNKDNMLSFALFMLGLYVAVSTFKLIIQ